MTVIVPGRPKRPIVVEGTPTTDITVRAGRGLPPGGTTGQALIKASDSDFATTWGTAVVAAAWNRAGNGGTSLESDFIGTTDNVPMVFKSNNLRRLVIGANGNIGINLSTVSPGQLLHLGDGNILLEGGGETAMLFKLGTTLDLGATHPNAPFVNPIFQIGRVIEGGDGAPQFRWMYSDDNKGERVVFELDSEGILSSVRQAGVRGSHFEAHRSGDTHPLFRLNSFPHMQLQMGNGGTDDTDIAIGRTAAQKGALQYGPPTAQVTAAEWSSAGFKVAVGGLIFPDNSVQTTAQMAANTVKANATAALANSADLAVGTNTVVGRVAGNIVAAQVVTAQIATNAADNTILSDMAANTIKANATGATADPADLAIGANTVVGRVAGNIVAAQVVDAQVASATLTNAKLANVATATIKGRATAGTGDPEDLTGTQATALLDTFTSGAKGLVPASGGGTTNFLRADGTWAAPSGGGGGAPQIMSWMI